MASVEAERTPVNAGGGENIHEKRKAWELAYVRAVQWLEAAERLGLGELHWWTPRGTRQTAKLVDCPAFGLIWERDNGGHPAGWMWLAEIAATAATEAALLGRPVLWGVLDG